MHWYTLLDMTQGEHIKDWMKYSLNRDLVRDYIFSHEVERQIGYEYSRNN